MDKQSFPSPDGERKQIRKPVRSSSLRCGKRTYFFDVNVASNKTKYLKITQSAFVGENGERKRNSFVLFPQDAQNFKVRLEEVMGYLAQ